LAAAGLPTAGFAVVWAHALKGRLAIRAINTPAVDAAGVLFIVSASVPSSQRRRPSFEFCHPRLWQAQHPRRAADVAQSAALPAAPPHHAPSPALAPESALPWALGMALKSTIFKAALQIADMDRALYADHQLTLARHPSETDERLMARVLAFALNVPADDHGGALVFARGLSDGDEPDLWQHTLAGVLVHWIEVGQPADDRRLAKACSRAERVTLYCYSQAAPIWWAGIASKVARLRNLQVWQIPAEEIQALAQLVTRSMHLQVTVQEAQIWIGNTDDSVEIHLKSLQALHP
jgi:uncharacterized protein YaeQ